MLVQDAATGFQWTIPPPLIVFLVIGDWCGSSHGSRGAGGTLVAVSHPEALRNRNTARSSAVSSAEGPPDTSSRVNVPPAPSSCGGSGMCQVVPGGILSAR